MPGAAPRRRLQRDNLSRHRLTLARQVAANDRASFLNERNERAGMSTLAVATRSGRPFFVRLAGDILGCDGDVDADDDAPGSVLAAQQMEVWLNRFGVPSVIVRSGRPGHAHLFARPRDEHVLAAAKKVAGELGLQARQDIRPPLAAHRLGLPVSLLSPTDPEDALSRLAPDRPSRQLTPAMTTLLERGLAPSNRYPSNSEAVQAVLTAAVASDWTLEEATVALVDAPALISEKHLDGLADWLLRGWLTAVQHVGDDVPSSEVRRLLVAVRQAAESAPWKGTAGSTDQRVVLVLVDIGLSAMTATVNASVRTVAAGAGIGVNTASASLRRLCQSGWIERLPRELNPLHALSYLLLDPTTGTRSPRPPSPTTSRGCQLPAAGLTPPSLDVGANLWRRGAGGASVERIHRYLRGHGPDDRQGIHVATGMAQSTVDRALARMVDLGLVRASGGRYRAVVEVEPETVAAKLGTGGRREKDQVKYDKQRQARNDALKQRRDGS